jgi:valyl-tRNA synthetase
VKLGAARVEEYRRFVTKLWNAARLCEMNAVRPDPAFDPAAAQGPLARWMLDAANTALAEATAALEAYRFDDYAAACYRFTWNTFCDWFLEFAKPSFAADAELRAATAHVLGMLLRLLHPVMPFVSATLWQDFGFGEAEGLIRAPWPDAAPVTGAAEARAELEWVVRLIGEVRTVRSEMNVPPSILAPLLLKDATAETMARAGRWSEVIGRMARASEVSPLSGEPPRNSAQMGLDEATIVLPLEGLIDLAAERVRLTKERAKAEAELKKVQTKLSQADFIARAKPEVVEENRERLAAFTADMTRLDAAMKRIE